MRGAQSSRSNMALRLALALITVTGATLAQKRTSELKYEATAFKRELNATSFYPMVPYTIPNGQCTGVLDGDVIPPWCVGVNGISLIARDRTPVSLDIMADLQSAVVYRQENSDGVCAGTAAVKIKVSCQNLAPDAPPYIRSTASGQNWPEAAKINSSRPLRRTYDLHLSSNEQINWPETDEKQLQPVPLSYSDDMHLHANVDQNLPRCDCT